MLGPPEDFLADKGVDCARFDKFGGALIVNGNGRTHAMNGGGSIRFLDTATGRERLRLEMNPSAYHFALSPDGRWCAGWPYACHPLRVWSLPDGKLVKELNVDFARGTAFSPDGNILISQEAQNCVAWDTRTWLPVYSFHRSKQPSDPLCGAFAPDGRMAAIRYHLSSVRLFDPANGHEIATLDPPDSQAILGLAFSPDGARLAVATATEFIQIWDLRAIRAQLPAMNLDWELPPYSPASTNAPTGPITVTILNSTNAPPFVRTFEQGGKSDQPTGR